MTKLTDTQAILLSSASQRENGSVLPLPGSLKASGGTTKALAALLRRGFIAEHETSVADAVHRIDGDLRYALLLTLAGADAIGVETNGSAAGTKHVATLPPPDPAPKRVTKAATVLALMSRDTGATLPELIDATGWLPHTTRAALTGLRKKGHEITRSKRDGATCYRIAEQA